ncbi:unnamed protein product [Peniophora sp. CBMAI 1063]|nr:unnamed protein product [Peniophora sp. CBMAI 1063]
MGRKRAFLDDGDDSDSVSGSEEELDARPVDEDPDERDERQLFENPYGRKRQRRGKDDAIYGVFGDDSEEEGFGKKKERRPPAKRSDWAKAPTFVSKQAEPDGKEAGEEDEEMADAADSSDDASRPASPRVREASEDAEEEDERPRFGGLGLGASRKNPPTSFSGFTRSGIGASRPAAVSATASAVASAAPSPPSSASPAPPAIDDEMPESLPSAFGAASRAQRSFVRSEAESSTPRGPAVLAAHERVHFSKLKGSFGSRMLEKMGWQAGMGLGSTGEGIVTPIESKLRPKGAGIAFQGFKEKTEQSKAEARRKGIVDSDDEKEEGKKKAGRGKGQPKRADAWQKPKKVRTRVEHKTYEQIVADAGQDAAVPSGVGIIIDATGATPREVASLADVSNASWTPTSDSTRIPEVRHNLRLITEAATADLQGLAREGAEIQKRRKTIQSEDMRLRKRVSDEADLIARMQKVHLVCDDIQSTSKSLASSYEATLDPLSPYISQLVTTYPHEYDRYRLDEVVVAAIAPIVRRSLQSWQPLEEPTLLLDTFRLWRRALKITEAQAPPRPETQVSMYGATVVSIAAPAVEVPMTPFESLLWNLWLPRVRSAINNDWDARKPHAAVRLYESWSTFLPPFIRDNFLDQLILPKVAKAVAEWSARRDTVSLRAVVFPWLPHVGLRMEDYLGDARRKLKSVLRGWQATDSLPADLSAWHEVFNTSDWDAMVLKYVVPKLGAHMREDFRVNPREQDMGPLERTLAWAPLLRGSIVGSLLEAEFFPKWLDTLYIWLVQPRASFEEVAQWLAFWRGVFPEDVQSLSAVQAGFTRGLDMVNKAIDLGPRAPTQLPRPQHRREGSPAPTPAPAAASRRVPARTHEITFRSIVEEFAAEHNLMLVPTQRVHEKSRMPLFRVSPTADGKGGVPVYILDDAVYAPDAEGDYRAISLENMVLRATKAG